MLKHFSLITLFLFFLNFWASAQSQIDNFHQIKITENNLSSKAQLETFIDSMSQISPSSPAGKFIKSPLGIANSQTEILKNHRVNYWKLKTHVQ